ncbi:MAG: hypothetical protein OXH64_07430 [Rhodospirillaceae bacterium]|nr:hypothetical protein [Rhodospirillaceae bacterium]
MSDKLLRIVRQSSIYAKIFCCNNYVEELMEVLLFERNGIKSIDVRNRFSSHWKEMGKTLSKDEWRTVFNTFYNHSVFSKDSIHFKLTEAQTPFYWFQKNGCDYWAVDKKRAWKWCKSRLSGLDLDV